MSFPGSPSSVAGRSSGQTINIDWSIGLSLFLVTILSSVVFLIDPITQQDEALLDNKAEEVQDRIQREGARTNYRNSLMVRSGDVIEDVPFHREYGYSLDVSNWVTPDPVYLNIPGDSFAAVSDTGNRSLDFIYFKGSISSPERYTDLSASSSQISNSDVSIDHSSDVDSASINGREAIQSIEIQGSSGLTETNKIYVGAFNDNLKVFNASSEFIVEQPFNITTGNYSTLYWHEDGNYSTSGTGTIRQGETQGFALADSDLGVTVTGDLNAEVSKPSENTIRAEINADRARVRLHESGAGYGEKRIQAYDSRRAFMGAEKRYRSLFADELQVLDDEEPRSFQRRFRLEDWGYNITVRRSRRIANEGEFLVDSLQQRDDWLDGSFNASSVSNNDNSGNLGIGTPDGGIGQFREDLIVYWRLDREVSGDGGTVDDYSAFSNSGSTVGGIDTGESGTFSTGAYNLSGGNIDLNSPELQGTPKTVAFWIKTSERGSSYNTLLSWTVENDQGTQSARTELDGDSSRIYTRWITDPADEGYRTGDGGVWSRSGTTSFNDTEWHFYASTFDGDDLVEYWDGELYTNSTGINSEVASFSDGSQITLHSANLRPRYDNLMIFNRSLSAQEIKRLYFYGTDGSFRGEYTSNTTYSDGVRDWTTLEVTASEPAGTEARATVQALDDNGNVIDSDSVDLADGENSYQIELENSVGSRVVFSGSSDSKDVSWQINSSSLYAEGKDVRRRLLSQGERIAIRDTSVSNRQFTIVSGDGRIAEANSRVVIWR